MRWSRLIVPEAIKRSDFSVIEKILEDLDQKHWPPLSDHLFEYCDEVDPWPLVRWAVTSAGLRCLITERLFCSDRNVNYITRFLKPFHIQVDLLTPTYNTCTDERQREEIVNALLDHLLKSWVDNIEYCPV